MAIFVFIVGSIYLSIILLFVIGWTHLPYFQTGKINNYPKVSVIIPMRNEAANIESLLNCLKNQIYPENFLEIILVDDHSSDNTLELINKFYLPNTEIVNLSNQFNGKKAAVKTGIEASNGDLIILTDADCIMNSEWIACYVSYYQQYNPVLMLGPVCAIPGNSPFAKMQALEMFSLLGSTAGAAGVFRHIMCNGANLSFPKYLYPEIKHIYNSSTSSGDDIFVLQELKKKYRQKIHFVKSRDLIVYTKISSTILSFFNQRKRWVSKAPLYNDIDIITTAFFVLLINISLLGTFILGLISYDIAPFLYLLLIKSLADYLILNKVTTFFREKSLMLWFPIVQSIYFVYVSFTVLITIFVPGSWKNRVVR